ncbi:MAG: hypothetical protein K8T90_18505 [Planctomycetes bacterium]|nr:hypothetical protein [Planctomycetota bacterium]
MREADRNDVDLVLKLYDLRREPEMRKARKFVVEFQPKTTAELLEVMNWAHPENAHVRQAVSYWEMVADFAARGLLHPEMFAAHCGEGILIYAKFLPFRDEVRAAYNPRFLANLQRAVESHPAVAEKAKMMGEMLARMAAQAAMPAVTAKKAAKPSASKKTSKSKK